MDIKSLNINNTNYPICDQTARERSVFFLSNVTGTAAVTKSPYCFAKYDVTNSEIKSLYDGLTVAIKVPVAGSSYGTCLQINSLGYHPIVYNVNTAISTKYSVNSIIFLVYYSGASGTVYNNSASSSSISGCWMLINDNTDNNTVAQCYCSTASATAAKTATCSGYYLLSNSYLLVTLSATNTSASAITLNVNSKGAKPIYIDGEASSATNYSLTRGTYLVYYDGTNYYFRTDGNIPNTEKSRVEDTTLIIEIFK